MNTTNGARLRIFLSHTDVEFANVYNDNSAAELRRHGFVIRNPHNRVLHGAELARAAEGCEVIIAHRSAPGSKETFASAPGLVAFLRAAVDISTIDIAAASAHGVLVTHVSAGFADAVAELGLGIMIDLARGISRWKAIEQPGTGFVPRMGIQLARKTLGVVGYGRIGRRLCALAQRIGMVVCVHDPYNKSTEPGIRADSFANVLANSDFVVCLAAALPTTQNLFDAAAFGAMRQGACFINLSRGELVDEAALEASLNAGHLRGAGLDVGRAADQMPASRFFLRSDVVATPHIGGMTREARQHQAMDTVQQVAALAAARLPDGAVNPEAAHRLSRLGIQITASCASSPSC